MSDKILEFAYAVNKFDMHHTVDIIKMMKDLIKSQKVNYAF
jgi:hypothetical protein